MLRPPTPISAQELATPYLHGREGRAHIRRQGTQVNQQRRWCSLSATAPAFDTHPSSRIYSTRLPNRQREDRAYIHLDGVHTFGSTYPCSRTHSSNSFPAEEKAALTFCALTLLLPRHDALTARIPAQEFGQFWREHNCSTSSRNALLRHSRIWTVFEKWRALHCDRRAWMGSSIHPCSRIWTGLEWEYSYVEIGSRGTPSTRPCSRIRRLDVLDCTTEIRIEEYVSLQYSLPSSACRLQPYARRACPLPCSRIWMGDQSFLAQQHC